MHKLRTPGSSRLHKTTYFFFRPSSDLWFIPCFNFIKKWNIVLPSHTAGLKQFSSSKSCQSALVQRVPPQTQRVCESLFRPLQDRAAPRWTGSTLAHGSGSGWSLLVHIWSCFTVFPNKRPMQGWEIRAEPGPRPAEKKTNQQLWEPHQV